MKRLSGKLLNVGIAALLASTLIVAGRSATSAHPAAHASLAGLPTIRLNNLVGEAHWTHTLDPAFVTDATSYSILDMTQAGFVKWLENGQVVPNLFTWRESKNRRVYWFTLRSGARFSDGHPVTVEDAAYTLNRSLAKSTASPVAMTYLGHIVGADAVNSGKASKLRGVKILNAHTIQISVDKPIAFFLKALTYPTAWVVERRVVAGHKPNTYMTNACAAGVGAGPFRLVCRNRGGSLSSFFPSGRTPSITVEPNPYYFGRHPQWRAVMPVIPTVDVNYRQYKAGGIDVTGIPTADITREKHSKGYVQYPTSQVDYITPDETTAPFNNVHCRLAVAYAIDRNTIDYKVLHSAEVPYYDVVPRRFLGFYNSPADPHYDAARAQSEMNQCPGKLKGVEIKYPSSSSDIDNEFAAISSMINQAGGQTTVKKLTLNDWYDAVGQPLSKTATQLVSNGWIMDYQDPQDYVTLLLRAGSNYDIGGFDNPQFNSLVDRADVAPTDKQRARLYRQAQHIALSTGAWISVGNVNGYALVKPSIHGFVGTLQGLYPRNHDYANITVGR